MTRGEEMPTAHGDKSSGDMELLQRVTAHLTTDVQRTVRTAVADAMLEGWSPTEVQLLRLAALAAGKLTYSEYAERCIGALDVS
ncbi:hypothetical protein [Mycolicibacterium farcinogenes]|uniref:Uncharacterized protein n=1 Tax=Mycolicibacterium farcinogenes TaxID=1802 RepID=A0ACD1FHP6_MYCFR|nr:hypothetical protein [Mycolicibacterium farcinogenes]QZH66430.1 hypothetical protein K6L26_01560 [Mycolicibacterium farcinogenes]